MQKVYIVRSFLSAYEIPAKDYHNEYQEAGAKKC